MALSPWQLCFHADLKCRVRACSNKRIVTGNNAATVSSPYCRQHACTVCLKFKTRFKRGHGEEKICHHHGCALAECKESRCPKKSSPYCSKHACSVKDCEQPRQSPGLCCRQHTCHGRGCINCIHPSSSPPSPLSTGRDPPYYCHGHQICQADGGCESLVFHDVSHRPAKYCFRHFCAASAACEGQRVEGDGAQACREHSCALHPTCAKPRVDPVRSLFCEDHACADPGCRKQTYEGGTGGGTGSREGGKWCADHMCLLALLRQADCENRREGTAANPLYCADHGPCARRCPRAGVGVGSVGAGAGAGCRGGMMCFRASAAAVMAGGERGGGRVGGGFCACHSAGDGGDDGGDEDDDDDDESITDHGDRCVNGSGGSIGGCVRGGTCDCDDGVKGQ
ncbi:uncharacterized protein F4812DRAFT_467727 [Daldinia caldariorum]|uniref:uncharacterized protein n=1 Tax=Daldinia caldariorum TaxID=326644 RepID=UPI00200830BC|nr:uncharacterized protein F4812DRAFT_467727 [Daldinia caldariorum]KAI1471769.1 hypothetical protein F4812DRAFT_467727 [Daldinia caldariorum]